MSLSTVYISFPKNDPMHDLDVNMVFWSMFLNASLRAAVHLGQGHDANTLSVKKTSFLEQWVTENNHFKDVNRVDEMPMELEWKIFPGIVTLGLLEEIESFQKRYCVNLRTSQTALERRIPKQRRWK